MKRLLLAAAAALLLAAAVRAPAADPAPKPWKPGAAPASIAPGDMPAETLKTVPVLETDAPKTMPFPPGVTRSLDLMYQPSVPDSILPLVPLYRQVVTDEVLSAYIGALRQDLPVREYPVIMGNQTVHVSVDGREGQGHLAIMLMVPWFGDIYPLPATEATLVAKVDDGSELKWKLQFAPGPNLYIPSQRPLPVSNPTMLTLPLPAGPHRVRLQLKDLKAQYAFLLLGQPVLTPPAIARPK
jgi:hypothetical protein